MKRTVLLLATLLALPAMAQNPNNPSVTPEAVIPYMAPPQIDGKIEDGEWSTFHIHRFVSQNGDLLVNRPGEFWIGSDRQNLYVAVRTAVHPQAGVLAKQEPKGEADIGDIIYDDSIEIWFDNNPGQNTGQYYQIMLNSKGALFDTSFQRKDKIAEKFWRAPLTQVHTVKDGLWTAEFAMPLKDLGVLDPTKTMGIRVCRNFKYPWDQARWEPLVRGFESAETMGKIRFSETAPIVSELGVQSEEGIDIGLALKNPCKAPLPLHVKIGGNAQDQPRYYENWDPTLAPGESRVFQFKRPFFTPGDYPQLGEILVTDPTGATFFHRDFKWRTAPDQSKIWEVLAPQSASEATQFNIAWLPSTKTLRWKTDFSNAKEKDSIRSARVVVVSAEGKPAGQAKITPVKSAGESVVQLPNLADGTYTAQLFLDAVTPADKPVKTVSFQHQNHFVWKDNTIGLSDAVFPPFTPLKVEKNAVDSVLRHHEMAPNGLWSQVQANGAPILSSPMRFELRSGGKVQNLDAKLRFSEARPSHVTALSDWSGPGLSGQTRGEFDIDGCMKVTLTLSPKGKSPIDGLDLVIPLRDDVARLMHFCGEGLRANFGGYLPTGQGEIWNSTKAPRDKLLGPFLPYIWLGDENRGLVWFASNDRGWIVDPEGKIPALSLERQGDTLNLRLRLIQQSTTLTEKHEIVFGLQATPVKPMPENPNWRTRGIVSGGEFETIVFGMSHYWGSELYGIFPRNRNFDIIEKLAAAQKEGKSDTEFFRQYVEAYPEIKNEIMSVSRGGHTNAVIPYTNLRGEPMTSPEWRVYQDEWRRSYFPDWRSGPDSKGSIDFALIPVKSRQDYLLYYYRELLKHGFDGIYWDNICIYDNENPATGKGYFRPDGAWQTDTDIWEMRELTRRTAVLSYQLGKRNLSMPHMTNANIIPVFSWTTISLDWEWKYGGSDFQDRFTREYIRAASLGLQSGNMPVILQGITEVSDPEKRKWVERTRIAAVVPHEINIWQSDPLYARLKSAFYRMGYGTPDCAVFHYWDKSPVAQISGLDSAWLVLDGKDQIALFISDYGEGGSPKIKLDLKKLGLKPNFQARDWESPGSTYTATGDSLELPALKKHDFRLLIIDKP